MSLRKLTLPIRMGWFWFRMGNMYLSFPFSFFGTLVVYYELVLKQIPFFSILHLWGFSIIFGVPYILIGAYVGVLHVRHQSLMEGVLAAPYSVYEFKMKPFGKEAELNMPMVLEQIDLWRATYKFMNMLTPEREKRLDDFEKKTRTLLDGGEVGKNVRA